MSFLSEFVEDTRDICNNTVVKNINLIISLRDLYNKYKSILYTVVRNSSLSEKSSLWPIVRYCISQRLINARNSIKTYRNIIQLRSLAFSGGGDDVVATTVKSTADSRRSGDYDVFDFQSHLIQNNNDFESYGSLFENFGRILTKTAQQMIDKSELLRLLHNNILRVERESKNMRHEYETMLLAEKKNISLIDGTKVVYASKDRIDAQNQSESLQINIQNLNSLLERAPIDAQIRLQQKLQSMQEILEQEEYKLIKSWVEREQRAKDYLSNVREINESLEKINSAIESIENLRDILQRSISQETRQTMANIATLKRENDLLESFENNTYRRILHELQILRHKDGGSTKLNSREIEYVRDTLAKKNENLNLDDFSVAMTSDQIRTWQNNFVTSTCDRLLLNAEDESSFLLETRVNRTRDRLTAFLFRYGDEIIIRDIRTIAENKLWSRPRDILTFRKKVSPVATWLKKESEDEEFMQQARKTREHKYEIFFTINWSLMNRVSGSVIDTILKIFHIRFSTG